MYMQSSMNQSQQEQALSLSSLYIQTFGARTYLDAFKDAFPRECQNLVDVIIGQQKKKGVLLDAGSLRRKPVRVEDTAPAERRPSRYPGDRGGAGRTRKQPEGTEAAVTPDSKDLPV